MLRRWVVVTLILVVLGGVMAVGPAPAADKVILSLNWFPYALHFGVYAAVERGFYRDANIDLEIIAGQGSGDTVKRIAVGSAAFGMADASSVVLGRAKGLTVKQIAILMDQSADAVYFVKGSGITKPKDLEGRTIGAAAGETPLTIFPAFADAAGIDPKKVQWVNIAPPAKIPSLMAKKVDSIITFTNEDPVIRRAAAKAGVEYGQFIYRDHGIDYYSIGLIARDQILQEQPELARRFVDATMRGYVVAIENPEAAADAFMKHNKETSRDLAVDQWKAVLPRIITPMTKDKGLGYIDGGKMTRTVELMKRFYPFERPVTADDVYTMKFLSRFTAKGM